MAASLKVRLLRVCQRELRRTVRVTVDARMRVLVFWSFHDRSSCVHLEILMTTYYPEISPKTHFASYLSKKKRCMYAEY